MPRRLALACLLVLGGVGAIDAQTGVTGDETSALILPTGARSMGMGQLGVASSFGTEALFWNPALIARAHRELSLTAVSGVVLPEADLALAGIYSLPRAFSVGLSWRYLNQGVQDATESGEVQSGTFVVTASTFAAAFAAPFGDRIAAGVELKVLRVAFDCTGTCPNAPQNSPVTGAVDVGAQYIATKDSLVVFGAALRNLGLPLQFNDAPQADPLPSRFALGVEIAPKLTQYPTVRLRGGIEMVARLSGPGSPGWRFGGEASWLDRYHGRVGYVYAGPNGGGPTVGGGASFARWRVDFAQFLSDNASESGSKPTYLAFRYVF